MGKLNISHHKSWHLYNKDNIERVKKDEEKERQLQEKKTIQKETAEKERRLQLLRKGKAVAANINTTKATNPEYEKEEKEKKDKFEAQFTMHLPSDSSPWYIKKSKAS